MKRKPSLLILAVLALALAACGTGESSDSAELPVDDGTGNAAGACLAGAEDCDDLGPLPSGDDEPLFIGDEPVTPGPDGDDGGLVLGGGMSVADATAQQIDGGFAIVGFYFDDGTGALLCDALAESFPPQCGGASIPVDNSVGVELDGLVTEGEVTWTDQPAVLVGEIVDGVFVVTPIDS